MTEQNGADYAAWQSELEAIEKTLNKRNAAQIVPWIQRFADEVRTNCRVGNVYGSVGMVLNHVQNYASTGDENDYKLYRRAMPAAKAAIQMNVDA